MYNRAGYVFIFTYLLWRELCWPLNPEQARLCVSSKSIFRFDMKEWTEVVLSCFVVLSWLKWAWFLWWVESRRAIGWQRHWTKHKRASTLYSSSCFWLPVTEQRCVLHLTQQRYGIIYMYRERNFMSLFHICALKPFKYDFPLNLEMLEWLRYAL